MASSPVTSLAMTPTAAVPAALATAQPSKVRLPWRGVALLAMGAALVVGFAVRAGPAPADAELARLLQFMAVVKGAMSVGLGAVIAWRFAHPVSKGFALAYLIAGVMLFASPGIIWQQHVVLGAVLFHAGLVLVFVAGWRDGAARERATQRWSARRA